MKYNEDKILKEIGDYIKSTYGEHYSTGKGGFQVLDLLKTLKIGKDFCHANAIKYLCRYGKKNGKNRKDLLKAVHYVILLMSSEDEELIKQQTDPSHNQWGVNGEPKGRTQSVSYTHLTLPTILLV